MNIPMLDLSREYQAHKVAIDAAIEKCLSQQHWILGPEVFEFEQAVSQFLSTPHCIGTASGTEALLIALRAIAIQKFGTEFFTKEQKILVPAFTFTATADVVLRAGATPVCCDIDLETFTIDCTQVAEYLDQHADVVGIIPVHLYGHAANMQALQSLAQEHRLFIVEDVAQAFGGSYEGRALGTLGDIGCYSFFPSKNLGCFGDGGMVSTADSDLAEILRILIRHGGEDKYNASHVGYNARLDTLQAAILQVKLQHLTLGNQKRSDIAAQYMQGLAEIASLDLPIVKPWCTHAFHQFTLRIPADHRQALQTFLQERGIASMIYYPVPLHQMTLFSNAAECASTMLHAEKAAATVLSLPIGPYMSAEEVSAVIQAIQDYFIAHCPNLI